MNKQQNKILLTKILPKAILLLLIVGAGISFFVFKFKGEEAKKNTEEFIENGGNQAADLVMNRYDSLKIGNLKIKYSNKYNITDKFGSESSGGLTLMQEYPQDELTIGYSSNELLGKPYGSIRESIVSLEEEIVKTLKSQIKEQPKLSEIEIIKLGLFDTHIREITYKENHLYIYGIASQNHFLTFTSHKKHFLNAIIRNIEIYENEQSKENESITDDSNSSEIKTVNRLEIPLYEWKIVQDLDIKEIKTHLIILGNDEDIMGIISTTNDYITNLREYSDYYNEKTVRNMKPSGLILTSKGVKNGKFQGINSVTELFSAYHKPTGKKYEMEAVTIKIGNYFYNLSYTTNEKSKKVINNIQISNQ